jgi:t-SNARE complex subunit (syntaxin)
MPDIKILEQCKSISSTLETLRNEASRPHASVTLIGHNSNFRERLDAVKKSIRELKSSTVAYDSSDITHIEKVKSDFSTTIQVFRELEASFRVDSRETVKRQLRIINPNVSSAEIEAEIEAAIQNAETPIFQQAVSAV